MSFGNLDDEEERVLALLLQKAGIRPIMEDTNIPENQSCQNKQQQQKSGKGSGSGSGQSKQLGARMLSAADYMPVKGKPGGGLRGDPFGWRRVRRINFCDYKCTDSLLEKAKSKAYRKFGRR